MATISVRIVCWSPDVPDQMGDINLCASSQLPKLREWAGIGGVTGGRWYQVRNVEIEEIGTFAWLARYRLAGGPATIEGVRGDVHRFFGAVEAAMGALMRWDIDGYRSVRGVIRATSEPRHLLQLPLVLEVLDRFANDAVAPTVSASWCDPSRTDWFVGTLATGRLLTRAEKYLDALSSDLHPIVQPVKAAVLNVKREISTWRGKTNAQLADGASRYCYALAEHAVTLERPGAGVMLMHRAMDLFLLSLCFANGLATLTTNGPAYASLVPNRDRVSLLNNYWYLEQASVVNFDSRRFQWLKELNDVRNLLLYAHGTNGAEVAWLRNNLVKTGDVVRSIVGNDAWRVTARALFPVVTIRPSVLFDVESGIDSYLEEIKDLIPGPEISGESSPV